MRVFLDTNVLVGVFATRIVQGHVVKIPDQNRLPSMAEARAAEERDHRLLALWAAECAERVLPYFQEQSSMDDRPRRAIEAGRAWARGEIPMTEARTAAFAAHAAARDIDDAAARAAARAAGHAAATAHVATHAPHAAEYATKAIKAATGDAAAVAAEREWQLRHIPGHLLAVANAETRTR